MIRTLPNEPAKRTRDYTETTPPYLTREAAQYLVERGIEHLVVDLPSIDRAHDEGRLTAHRHLLRPAARTRRRWPARRARSARSRSWHTFADEAVDGPYLLQLQVPAINGDAVPSRPLLYRLAA